MIRFAVLAALALAVVLPARATAQPALPGGIQIIDAKVDQDKLMWTDTKQVPVSKEVAVEVIRNGMKVLEKRVVTVYEFVKVSHAVDLKGAKATDGAGKEIKADKLAEMLKESTPIVLVSGTVAEKHRKLFKDTTVFVELSQPDGLKKEPVPAPAPPAKDN